VATFGTRPAGPVVTTGTTLQLRSFVRYSDGTDLEVTGATSWTGTPLLTIDPSGLATGVSAGSTSVGASWFDPIDNVTRFAGQAATVTAATLSSIQVTAGLTSVAEGGILQHEANGTYSDGATRDLTTQVVWSSSDASAVTVSNAPFSSGLAFVAGIDTSPTIVATHAGVSGQRTLTIPSQTLIAIDVKTVAAPPLILPAGTKQTLIVEGVYSNGGRVSFGPQVEWSSSDGELGYASGRWFDVGTVFGSAPGQVTFSATVLGVTGSRTGTVTFR